MSDAEQARERNRDHPGNAIRAVQLKSAVRIWAVGFKSDDGIHELLQQTHIVSVRRSSSFTAFRLK